MTPYVPGLSKLPRTDFSEEERLFGKTSDEYYEATQVQRRLERQVRKYKRRIACGEERGLDMTGDRARLGQAQKRVRQWCKQNKLPRQYERERAYGVAKQPRAMGTLEVAQPLVPKGPGGTLGVNRKVVNSSGYRSRIEALPVPRKAANGIRRETGRILSDCNGTQHERVSAISWKSGRTVADSFRATPQNGSASLSPSQVATCAGTDGGVLLIHNHPANGRPSFTDIESVAGNSWVRGSFVACHDGTTYFIQSQYGSLEKIYNELREDIKAVRLGLSGDEVDALALDALYDINEEEKWFRIRKS